jgi:hypothetical protein
VERCRYKIILGCKAIGARDTGVKRSKLQGCKGAELSVGLECRVYGVRYKGAEFYGPRYRGVGCRDYKCRSAGC